MVALVTRSCAANLVFECATRPKQVGLRSPRRSVSVVQPSRTITLVLARQVRGRGTPSSRALVPALREALAWLSHRRLDRLHSSGQSVEIALRARRVVPSRRSWRRRYAGTAAHAAWAAPSREGGAQHLDCPIDSAGTGTRALEVVSPAKTRIPGPPPAFQALLQRQACPLRIGKRRVSPVATRLNFSARPSCGRARRPLKLAGPGRCSCGNDLAQTRAAVQPSPMTFAYDALATAKPKLCTSPLGLPNAWRNHVMHSSPMSTRGFATVLAALFSVGLAGCSASERPTTRTIGHGNDVGGTHVLALTAPGCRATNADGQPFVMPKGGLKGDTIAIPAGVHLTGDCLISQP